MTSLMTRNVKLILAAVFLFDRTVLYFLMVTHFYTSLLTNRDHPVSLHTPVRDDGSRDRLQNVGLLPYPYVYFNRL
jgi:hypothetical protein